MGTWGEGLMDNDAALDGLNDLTFELFEELEEAVGASDAARITGLLGVLLQLTPFDFTDESDQAPLVREAARVAVTECDAAARPTLDAIANGGPLPPGEPMSASDAALLAEGGHAPFAPRQPALFAHAGARAVVQRVVERIVEAASHDFGDDYVHTDLSREALAMGQLGALLVLVPATLPKATLEGWRARARAGVASLVGNESDGELAFHQAYYARLDGVLAALLARGA